MSLNLYIIAGPNGSGKSLFSSSLVNVDFEVFDGDKYVASLKKQYPETGSDILQNSVNEIHFKEAKNTAIKQKGNFAFETNFSAEDPMFSMRQFKAAGYSCHLIFMGMPDVEECIQRVSFRVRAGGHKVSEDSIKYNFLHGYKNLYKHYHLFDSVTLIDSAIAETEQAKIPVPVLIWTKDVLTLFEQNYPDWVRRFVNESDKKSTKK